MANEDPGQEPNADAQAASAAAALAASAAAGDQASQSTRSAADLEAIISKLNRENAERRTENTTLKKYRDDAEAAKLSDIQKAEKAVLDAQAEKAGLIAELKQERASNAVKLAARDAGVNAELAEKLITVEFDADGKAINVEDALKALLAKHPELKKIDAAAQSSAGTNPNRERGGGVLTFEQVSKMTHQQLRGHSEADIDAAVKRGPSGRSR